jgi:hypothetical protein
MRTPRSVREGGAPRNPGEVTGSFAEHFRQARPACARAGRNDERRYHNCVCRIHRSCAYARSSRSGAASRVDWSGSVGEPEEEGVVTRLRSASSSSSFPYGARPASRRRHSARRSAPAVGSRPAFTAAGAALRERGGGTGRHDRDPVSRGLGQPRPSATGPRRSGHRAGTLHGDGLSRPARPGVRIRERCRGGPAGDLAAPSEQGDLRPTRTDRTAQARARCGVSPGHRLPRTPRRVT